MKLVNTKLWKSFAIKKFKYNVHHDGFRYATQKIWMANTTIQLFVAFLYVLDLVIQRKMHKHRCDVDNCTGGDSVLIDAIFYNHLSFSFYLYLLIYLSIYINFICFCVDHYYIHAICVSTIISIINYHHTHFTFAFQSSQQNELPGQAREREDT